MIDYDEGSIVLLPRPAISQAFVISRIKMLTCCAIAELPPIWRGAMGRTRQQDDLA